MTLLSICQDACAMTPVSLPTAIVGNSDQTAKLLLAIANQAGQALARRPQGGWVTMIREWDFTTNAIGGQSGTIDNSGPNGNAVISGLATTAGIAPSSWVASGPGLRRNSVVTAVDATTVTLNQPAVAVTGSVFTLDSSVLDGNDVLGPGVSLSGTYIFGQADYPLPSDFQRPVDGTFWDRSRFWAMRGPQSPQQWQMFKSSVMGTASIQRRFRFRAANVIAGTAGTPGVRVLSIDPTPFDNGAQLVFEYVSNGWCSSADGTLLQSAWKADGDVGVLSEYLLGLGVNYRFLRRLGLAYNEELDEYERETDKAVAHDGGSAILNMAPTFNSFLLSPGNLPESGYGDGGTGGGAFTIGVSGIGSGAGIG
jgi:hypothetical protein